MMTFQSVDFIQLKKTNSSSVRSLLVFETENFFLPISR